MIVRRFMNWLRLTVAASLGGAPRRSQKQPVREPALVGAASQTGLAERASSGLSLSSWLDNGRRLRPRLRLTPRDPGLIPTRPLRHKIQPTAMPATASTPATPAPVEAPAPRANLAPPAPEPTETARIVPVTHTTDGHGDDLGDLERLDTETRRLMLLRHLVRKRVFNEGFSSSDVPRQYRRSLGLEEPVPED